MEYEFVWHFTSAWRDVQQKASRIRGAGHVRVISSSPAFLVGEVRGDTNIYQTTLMREPGSQRVALWECGCAWAAYSWGRSGRWKKYEGRMCSHALALLYEGQSKGWGGREIKEDLEKPLWLSDPSITVKVPGDYKKPDGPWRLDAARHTTGRPVFTDTSLNDAPADVIARTLIDEGTPIGAVVGLYRRLGVVGTPGIINRIAGAPKVAAADSEDGCMIALRPPERILREVFVEDGEEFSNLHLTVAYLEKSDDLDKDAVEVVVAEWAAKWSGFPGQLSGYGVFENGEDRVLYASLDIPGLDRARDDLVDMLAGVGIALPDDHGFVPHMTLAYGDDAEAPDEMSDAAKEEFIFDMVYVAYGPEWHQFPLATLMPEQREAALKWEMIGAGEYTVTDGDHQFDITHRIIPDEGDGYGRRDDWVLRHTGPGYDGDYDNDYPTDPIWTLREAKEEAEAWLVMIRRDLDESSSSHTYGTVDDGIADFERQENQENPFDGVTLKEDDDGWYVKTHRARSDSYPTPEDIPDGDIEFIRSTGSSTMYDEGYADQATDGKPDPEWVQTLVNEENESGLKEYADGVADAYGDPHHRLPDTVTWGIAGLPEDGTEAAEDLGIYQYSELKDEPEAALPETTADDEDEVVSGDQRLDWLMGESKRNDDDMDIAASARAHLAMAKTSVKTFSTAEQEELINEGESVMASNLDRLDLTGTHYEPLEEAYQMTEGDEDWLW